MITTIILVAGLVCLSIGLYGQDYSEAQLQAIRNEHRHYAKIWRRRAGWRVFNYASLLCLLFGVLFMFFAVIRLVSFLARL